VPIRSLKFSNSERILLHKFLFTFSYIALLINRNKNILTTHWMTYNLKLKLFNIKKLNILFYFIFYNKYIIINSIQ